MKLKDYLYNNNIKTTEFADKLKVTRAYMNAVKLEKAKPSVRLKLMIQMYTNGAVSISDFPDQE